MVCVPAIPNRCYDDGFMTTRNISSRFFGSSPGISEMDYTRISEETLESLTEFFENIPEHCSSSDPDYDVSFAMGVLTGTAK